MQVKFEIQGTTLVKVHTNGIEDGHFTDIRSKITTQLIDFNPQWLLLYLI